MQLFSVDLDNVINAYFLTGRVSYQYALDNFVSLINKLDIQRKVQNESFYKRLEKDYQIGCITPAITIAFIDSVDHNNIPSLEKINAQLEKSVAQGFILDGIQRLNTLKRVFEKQGNELNTDRYLYLNIIICPSRDNLLYRMVTLNNGQKPMTARHQIEILAENIYDFNNYSFEILTEKEAVEVANQKSFKKGDLINAYISFLSGVTWLENKKIIEDKLDELVARKIIENKITDNSVDFDKVLRLIERMYESELLYTWLKNANNLIGLVVALRTRFKEINAISNRELEEIILIFEKAFKNLNVSKIKVSRERRNLSSYYFSNLDILKDLETIDLSVTLSEQM
jgi:hypothetical protein